MDNEREVEKKQFAEEVGILFEQTGMPRMAGRIVGWLLISDPAHQSTSELVEALTASKGSISTTTRLLIRIGLIERISLPGQRHDYFRVKPNAWHQMLKDTMIQTTTFRQLMEKGLELLRDNAHSNRALLEEMHDMYAFFEREFPVLFERWEQKRKEKQATSKATI